MGLFDDLGFGELLAIKDDMVNLGSDLIKDFTSEVENVEKTVTDTATEFKNQAVDIQSAVQQSTTLHPGQDQDSDKTA